MTNINYNEIIQYIIHRLDNETVGYGKSLKGADYKNTQVKICQKMTLSAAAIVKAIAYKNRG